MFTSYFSAKKYLEDFIPYTLTSNRTLRLERISLLCRLLGSPERNYPIIHVGGTSGKGSTATFAATILKNLGLKTGLHISPHLESLTERLQINDRPISKSQFVNLLNHVIPKIKMVAKSKHGQPTYFEILVALAFTYFANEKVDAAVIEVGLGGTLDATNVVPPSLVILTNISLDHTAILGKTVTKILKDKMGIIKNFAPAVISGVTQPQLKQMLSHYTDNLHIPLYLMDRDFTLDSSPLLMPGDFQHLNYTLAKKATEIFVQIYFSQLKAHLKKAEILARQTAFIPGRLEVIKINPLTVLDGAHNNAKIRALVDSLKKLYSRKKWIIVFAVKHDKPAKTMLRLLSPIAQTFIFTTFSQTKNQGVPLSSTPPQELAKYSPKKNQVAPKSSTAITKAQKLSQKLGLPILVTGSLYLVGEVRHLWIKD